MTEVVGTRDPWHSKPRAQSYARAEVIADYYVTNALHMTLYVVESIPLVWLGVTMTLVATKKAPFSAGGTT